jgi:CRP-like cAMP-binding protein
VSPWTDAERQALLAKSVLFSALAPDDLKRVLSLCRTRRLGASETLCHRGDPADHVFAILEGRVRVVAHSEDGREVVLRIQGRGEVCGELGLLHQGRRTATMVAETPCELLALPRREFLSLLETRPRACIALLGALSERISKLTDQLTDFVFLSLPSRLAKMLLELARADVQKTPEGLPIVRRLSQQALADRVGKTRESVNKQLRLWEEDGIVDVERTKLTIRRLDVLRRIAGEDESDPL